MKSDVVLFSVLSPRVWYPDVNNSGVAIVSFAAPTCTRRSRGEKVSKSPFGLRTSMCDQRCGITHSATLLMLHV